MRLMQFWVSHSQSQEAVRRKWDFDMKPVYHVVIMNFIQDEKNTNHINRYSLLFCFRHLHEFKEQPPELKGEIFFARQKSFQKRYRPQTWRASLDGECVCERNEMIIWFNGRG